MRCHGWVARCTARPPASYSLPWRPRPTHAKLNPGSQPQKSGRYPPSNPEASPQGHFCPSVLKGRTLQRLLEGSVCLLPPCPPRSSNRDASASSTPTPCPGTAWHKGLAGVQALPSAQANPAVPQYSWRRLCEVSVQCLGSSYRSRGGCPTSPSPAHGEAEAGLATATSLSPTPVNTVLAVFSRESSPACPEGPSLPQHPAARPLASRAGPLVSYLGSYF